MIKVKLSEKEIAKRRNIANQALASVRMEGGNPSKECLEITELYINGEITAEERLARVKANALRAVTQD